MIAQGIAIANCKQWQMLHGQIIANGISNFAHLLVCGNINLGICFEITFHLENKYMNYDFVQTKDTAKGMLLLNIFDVVAPSSAPAAAIGGGDGGGIAVVEVVVATSVANASNRSG